MGVTIGSNAAKPDIVRDLELTRVRATAMGAPYQGKAELFLGPSLATIAAITASQQATAATLVSLRAQIAVQGARCDALVLKTKDLLYNELGRPANDQIFNLWFPDGAASYTNETPSGKGSGLELLASLFESSPHPWIPADRMTASAAELRAAAKANDELHAHLRPVLTRVRLLQAQYRKAVKQAHIQLGRLKKSWKADGLTEVQIHGMIPDRPLRSSPAVAQGVATVPTEAPVAPPAPPLVVLPPFDDPADAVTAEVALAGADAAAK